ncbi:MAG: Gfo/Idh/MocA family oxidoreductase [Acidobacteria bacterium]|nr:Gfo/Idh/MocA family oxidoreductase [Acidobacteriota bacterium]
MKRVAVIGTGQFGHHHARVYAEMDHLQLVAVCDLNAANGQAVAQQYHVPYVADYRELIGKVDAVSLAVPTIAHHQIACDLLSKGIAVLVEKPLARTLAEADEMIAIARQQQVVLQVGHLERFNPAVSAARRIINKPRFFEGHRLSVFTPRSLDIDVVMDLMIHDLDVVLSFTQSEVTEIRAAGVPILTPKIDIANARVEFANGCVANLTASRVSAERVRKLRFFQPNQYISIDYATQETNVVTVNHTPQGRPDFAMQMLTGERDEPLRIEIESFLAALNGAPVLTSGEDGRRALALALGIVAKIKEHAEKIGVPFVG